MVDSKESETSSTRDSKTEISDLDTEEVFDEEIDTEDTQQQDKNETCVATEVNLNEDSTVIVGNVNDGFDLDVDCSSDMKESDACKNKEEPLAEKNDLDGLKKTECEKPNVYEGYGILNKSFSTSTMGVNDTLPTNAETMKRSSYIYPVVVDNIDINHTTTGPPTKSTSMPDIYSRISVVTPTRKKQKSCSCDCHVTRQQNHHSNNYNNKNNKRNTEAPSYFDAIATSSQHHACAGTHDFVIDMHHQFRASPACSPGSTPGRVRRMFQSQMEKMFYNSTTSSRNPSPVSSCKGLPHYRSLIFSILKDEPPKYEDVTGKKLADELVRKYFFVLRGRRGFYFL